MICLFRFNVLVFVVVDDADLRHVVAVDADERHVVVVVVVDFVHGDRPAVVRVLP